MLKFYSSGRKDLLAWVLEYFEFKLLCAVKVHSKLPRVWNVRVKLLWSCLLSVEILLGLWIITRAILQVFANRNNLKAHRDLLRGSLVPPWVSRGVCPGRAMQMALAAVCSASWTPVLGSGSSGSPTSHLCLVKLPTGPLLPLLKKQNSVCALWRVAALLLSLPPVDFWGWSWGELQHHHKGFAGRCYKRLPLLADGLPHLTSFLWVNGLVIRVKGFFVFCHS